MTDTQRLPKWLLQEWFRVTHDPISEPSRRVKVTIGAGPTPGIFTRFHGQGSSIGEAAKNARANREAAK